MGALSSGARRAALAGPFVFVVTFAAVAPSSAQVVMGPVEETSTAMPSGVDAAFDALGRSVIGNESPRARDDLRLEIDVDSNPAAVAEAFGGQAVSGLFGASGTSSFSPREAVRYETRLVGSEILPGAQLAAVDTGSAVSLAQERARRAVIDALSETSLGKSVGRFLYYSQETGLDSERNLFIPRIKPKLRYRSREVGLSLVWRF